MAWEQLEVERIREQYWQGGAPTCPADGTPLSLITSGSSGGYRVRAHCGSCASSVWLKQEDDPKAAGARTWTDDEKDALARSCNARRGPVCPIDGTSVQCKDVSGDGGIATWNVYCPRCGNQTYRQTY